MQQEAIELCLGQWVGAGLFQWILGGEDEKRLGQGMGDASIADRVLLHRLEQGSLGVGRGAVELIGEQKMGEYRAALNPEEKGRAAWRERVWQYVSITVGS